MATLPMLSTPKFKHTLVGLGKEIEYRPFTVKEQKILLLAKQDGSKQAQFDAVRQIIDLCTFGKLDIEKLAIFDVIDILLRLRSKSVDSVAKHTYKYRYTPKDATDEKEERIVINLDLDKISVKTDDKHKRTVILDPDTNYGIKLRYPTLNDISQAKDDFDQIARNIETIFHGEDVYQANEIPFNELQDFVDQMSTQNLKDIKEFYATMPRIEHSIDIKLKDGTTEKIVYRDLEDFFN